MTATDWSSDSQVVLTVSATIYLVNGIISVALAGIIILAMIFVPKLRKHPNGILFWSVFSDIFFQTKFLLSFALHGYYTTNEVLCYISAITGQFFGLASLSWNFLISVDLVLTLRNPFVKTSKNTKWYHLCAWGLSAVTTVIMLSIPGTIGDSGDNTCWIVTNKWQSLVRLVFFFPLFIYVVSSLGILIYSISKLRKVFQTKPNQKPKTKNQKPKTKNQNSNMQGLPESLASRYGLLLRMVGYTALFCIMWMGPILFRLVQLISFVGRLDSTDGGFGIFVFVLQVFSAVGVTAQSFGNTIVFITNPAIFNHIVRLCCRRHYQKWHELDHPIEEEEEISTDPKDAISTGYTKIDAVKDIDVILRRDMMFCIMLGISHTISQSDQQNSSSGLFDQQIHTPGELFMLTQDDFAGKEVFKLRRVKPENGRLSSTSVVDRNSFGRRDSVLSLSRKSSTASMTSSPSPALSPSSALSPTSPPTFPPSSSSIQEPQQQQQSQSQQQQSQQQKPIKTLKNSEFSFTEYARNVFRNLRRLSGIVASDYLKSFNAQQVMTSFIKQNFSEGKSGSFFCKTEDQRYIIKTISKSELHLLLKILRSYYHHIEKFESSLISRIFGLYSITMFGSVTIRFIVMSNVFDSQLEIHERYDLKGSWVNRNAKRTSSLKMDSDLRTGSIVISEERWSELITQLRHDVEFFRSCGIMDYSLLLGIHNVEASDSQQQQQQVQQQLHGVGRRISLQNQQRQQQQVRSEHFVPFFKKDEGGIYSTDGTKIYFVGIIDILQAWSLQKKLERFAKTVFLCKDANGISSINPDRYADRFLKRMTMNFFSSSSKDCVYVSPRSSRASSFATSPPDSTSNSTSTKQEEEPVGIPIQGGVQLHPNPHHQQNQLIFFGSLSENTISEGNQEEIEENENGEESEEAPGEETDGDSINGKGIQVEFRADAFIEGSYDVKRMIAKTKKKKSLAKKK